MRAEGAATGIPPPRSRFLAHERQTSNLKVFADAFRGCCRVKNARVDSSHSAEFLPRCRVMREHAAYVLPGGRYSGVCRLHSTSAHINRPAGVVFRVPRIDVQTDY